MGTLVRCSSLPHVARLELLFEDGWIGAAVTDDEGFTARFGLDGFIPARGPTGVPVIVLQANNDAYGSLLIAVSHDETTGLWDVDTVALNGEELKGMSDISLFDMAGLADALPELKASLALQFGL